MPARSAPPWRVADLHRRWLEEIGSWIADRQAEAPTRGTDDSQIENLRNLGYVGGGVSRGLAVGLVVTIVAMLLAGLRPHNLLITVMVVFLTSVLFSLETNTM